MKYCCQQSFDQSVCATAINVNIKKCRYSLWGQDWFHKIAKVVTKQMDDNVQNAKKTSPRSEYEPWKYLEV